jgi:hypothetical protein
MEVRFANLVFTLLLLNFQIQRSNISRKVSMTVVFRFFQVQIIIYKNGFPLRINDAGQKPAILLSILQRFSLLIF